LFANEYCGEMYHLSSSHLDHKVTPNHNLLVRLRSQQDGQEGFRLRRMDRTPLDARMEFMGGANGFGDEGGVIVFDPNEPGKGRLIKEHYQGKTYCVEVPNHIIYVRREGSPVWCGNSISVAKAGITARLQCRCSILGAANPKFGRFEEAQFIADQIDLPPALMSRFDLIFAMTDKPETDRDTKITKHILNVHRRGELLRNQELTEFSGAEIERMMEETKNLEPVYTKEFLRKYVAYSKRYVPILSDEAIKLITENYLQIRKQGEGENKSVPITARQLEAYVRLSEASARARLSRVVTLDDARRATNIVEYYLRKIAGEGGKLDIDIIATGTSRSQREQIVVLRSLIQEHAEPQKGIGLEAIIQLAEGENIPEERVRVLLKRLKESGEVYEPSSGFYRLASEGIE
jgi:replicative DNA helicase Mcm